jgi:hypothetical protein
MRILRMLYDSNAISSLSFQKNEGKIHKKTAIEVPSRMIGPRAAAGYSCCIRKMAVSADIPIQERKRKGKKRGHSSYPAATASRSVRFFI